MNSYITYSPTPNSTPFITLSRQIPALCTRRVGKFFKFHTFNCFACSLPSGQLRPLALCATLCAVAIAVVATYECLTFNRTKFYDCPHYYVCTVFTIFCFYLLFFVCSSLFLLCAHFALVLKICLFAPYLSCILF